MMDATLERLLLATFDTPTDAVLRDVLADRLDDLGDDRADEVRRKTFNAGNWTCNVLPGTVVMVYALSLGGDSEMEIVSDGDVRLRFSLLNERPGLSYSGSGGPCPFVLQDSATVIVRGTGKVEVRILGSEGKVSAEYSQTLRPEGLMFRRFLSELFPEIVPCSTAPATLP